MPSYLADVDQRRGLPGVALAVAVGAGRRIERRVLRIVIGIGIVELTVPEARAHHVCIIQARLDRLAQRDVGERALLGVEHDVRKAEGRGQHRFHAGRGLESRIRLDRQNVGELILAREHAFDARVRVGHRNEAQLVEQRLTLAAVPARRLLARTVAVEAHQLDILVRLALLEHVGTGADELGKRRGDRILGHDRREAVRQCQVRDQRRIGTVERDDDRIRALGLD